MDEERDPVTKIDGTPIFMKDLGKFMFTSIKFAIFRTLDLTPSLDLFKLKTVTNNTVNVTQMKK